MVVTGKEMAMAKPSKIVELEFTEEQLMNMSREEVTRNLTDRQRRFCEIYVKNFNGVIAAKKAGYSDASATLSWKLRQMPEVNLYLAWLKLKVSYSLSVRPDDIVEQYVRMAFADITDFVVVKNGRMILTDSDMMDGQIVKSIKNGRDGIQVELYNKLEALKMLERFFDTLPKDWKQRLEERRLELAVEKLELDKQKMGLGDDEIEDDGFIDALREAATEAWE